MLRSGGFGFFVLFGVIPGVLRADLPVEHLTVPPDRVAPSVRKDAIGVWMHFCRSTPTSPRQVQEIPIYTRESPIVWKLAGGVPLDQVRTISVLGYAVDPQCLDFTLYRFVVTDRDLDYMEVVVDVIEDRRVWVQAPRDLNYGRPLADYVVWLDRLGRDTIYADVAFLPGFFDAPPELFLEPSWFGPRITVQPARIARRWFPCCGQPLGDTAHLPVWLMLAADDRRGDFLRVTHTAGPYGLYPLDIPEIPGDSDTVWVPIRDRRGRLLIWFVDETD